MRAARSDRLALITFMAAVAFIPAFALWQIGSSFAERHSTIMTERERFLSLASRRVETAHLERQVGAMSDSNRRAGVLESLPPQETVARLEQKLDGLIQARGGARLGSEMLKGREEGGASVLMLKTILRVSASQAAELLKELEYGEPAFFIEALRLSLPGTPAPSEEAEMRVEVTLRVYVDPSASVDNP